MNQSTKVLKRSMDQIVTIVWGRNVRLIRSPLVIGRTAVKSCCRKVRPRKAWDSGYGRVKNHETLIQSPTPSQPSKIWDWLYTYFSTCKSPEHRIPHSKKREIQAEFPNSNIWMRMLATHEHSIIWYELAEWIRCSPSGQITISVTYKVLYESSETWDES